MYLVNENKNIKMYLVNENKNIKKLIPHHRADIYMYIRTGDTIMCEIKWLYFKCN